MHNMADVCDLHSGWAQQEAWHCIVISIVPKGSLRTPRGMRHIEPKLMPTVTYSHTHTHAQEEAEKESCQRYGLMD